MENKDTYNKGYLDALKAVISVCNQEVKFDEDNLSKVHGDIIGKSFIKGVKQVKTMVEKMIELVEEE
ncbi:MAG TPA: hypothetical protein PLA45_02395 [Candidatus Dojkabacteria bacterium]|nr:hypothetical protein [Candidatus Dojkabacteria bacterium]